MDNASQCLASYHDIIFPIAMALIIGIIIGGAATYNWLNPVKRHLHL